VQAVGGKDLVNLFAIYQDSESGQILPGFGQFSQRFPLSLIASLLVQPHRKMDARLQVVRRFALFASKAFCI